MVIWVCEALEVNNLTVLAVGLNHLDKDDNKDNKIASSGSDQYGSDKDLIFVLSESNDLYNNPFECQLWAIVVGVSFDFELKKNCNYFQIYACKRLSENVKGL